MAVEDFLGGLDDLDARLGPAGTWAGWRRQIDALTGFEVPSVWVRWCWSCEREYAVANECLARLWDIAAGEGADAEDAALVVCQVMTPTIKSILAGANPGTYRDLLGTLISVLWLRLRSPRPASWRMLFADLAWDLRRTVRHEFDVQTVELPEAGDDEPSGSVGLWGPGAGSASAETLELLAWGVAEHVLTREQALLVAEVVTAEYTPGRRRAGLGQRLERVAATRGVSARTVRRGFEVAVAALADYARTGTPTIAELMRAA